MQTSNERRQYERLEPQGSVFVVFRPEFSKIGPINDISRGGLGYTCLSTSDTEVPVTETSHLIDIIASNNSFYLANIPCKLVYYFEADTDQLMLIPDLVNRLCGVKFDLLTEGQEKQMNFFLENHTAGNA